MITLFLATKALHILEMLTLEKTRVKLRKEWKLTSDDDSYGLFYASRFLTLFLSLNSLWLLYILPHLFEFNSSHEGHFKHAKTLITSLFVEMIRSELFMQCYCICHIFLVVLQITPSAPSRKLSSRKLPSTLNLMRPWGGGFKCVKIRCIDVSEL